LDFRGSTSKGRKDREKGRKRKGRKGVKGKEKEESGRKRRGEKGNNQFTFLATSLVCD